jgi:multiple sugar transport system ATP-binding protein
VAEIVLDHITKRFPDGTLAVDDFNLTIADGEFVILVGPSGCGKSTTLNMIAGLEDITSGELRIGGQVVNTKTPKDRDIAMVFQSYALYPHMTVRENMGFALKLAKTPKATIDQKVEEAARILDLTQYLDRRPANLSGGQRQRVAMGRAIVRDPAAFLMDEPLSNLDAKLRVQMRTEVSRIQRRLGTTTVYVTHDQTEALTLGDRVAVMRTGLLQQVGSPKELYERPVNLFVAGFIGSPAMNFMSGTLEEGSLRTGLGNIPLAGRLRQALESSGVGREIIVGLRPENFEDAALVSAENRPYGVTFQATIDVVESMGSDVYVYFTKDIEQGVNAAELEELARDSGRADTGGSGDTVVARLDAATRIREGQPANLWMDARVMLVFDPATGQNITLGSSTPVRVSLSDRELQETVTGRSPAAPDLAASVAATQNRRAAMWLTHDLTAPAADPLWELDRHVVLARGRGYVLNVAVGINWPTNLVDPDTPSIDPILPPTTDTEYRLDVAVYSDSASAMDASVKELRLPRIGPSETVTFRLRMPTRGDSSRMRVLIYHREHVVQAFALHLTLGAVEEYRGEPVMRTELLYSRRQQLRGLDMLPPRLLSIATNQDSGGGTHRLMFGSTGGEISLSERTVDTARRFLRDRMADAFKMLEPGGRLAASNFDAQVKVLAERGYALWGKLYDDQCDRLQWKLNEVTAATTGTVQVLRLEPDFAFPWSMLYDWKLPTTVAEVNAAAVCRGGSAERACSCNPDTPGVCIRGFWGVRLVVEELVRQEGTDDYVDAVAGAAGSPAVVCTVGVIEDSWAQGMVDTLTKKLGSTRFEDLLAENSLLTRMWDPQSRPAVLLVVGHLTNTPVADEPDRPRIYVRCTERFLDTDALRRAKQAHGTRRWDPPHRPIVLLLGCDTGRSGLGEVHSFVSGLSSAGASAIVATEEKIDTRLAGDLAGFLVPALGRCGVGEALRAWRAGLMADGNPLGLVFTCFGSAGAAVPQLVS